MMVKQYGAAWAGAPRTPRTWQAAALPVAIKCVKDGRNAIISAVTGSGKSVLISELCWMAMKRVDTADNLCIVISTPTQNLVKQLSSTIAKRNGFKQVGQFYGKKKQADRKIIITCNPSVAKLVDCIEAQGRRVALLICDEVHKTEGDQIKEAVKLLNPASRIGFTATAFRADEGETLSLWDEIAFQYTLGDAWRDGVLVPFTPIPWDGEGDRRDTDGWCLRTMQAQAGPGVVSCLSIEDAEDYSRWLTDQGFPAEAVHSHRKEAENVKTIDKLLTGQIRCVAHVSMLSEGVDLPPLRWICMRRPVGSRVRFVQEVGRVLRILEEPDQWGPKTMAQVIDPHALFDEHGIAHPAALGDPPPKDDPKKRDRDDDELPPLPGLSAEVPPMQRVAVASAWARRLLLVMQADGLALPTPDKWVEGAWRGGAPTPKQLGALARLKWVTKFIPNPHRDQIKWAIDARTRLKSGACSDLIDVLKAVATASEPKRSRARESGDFRIRWKWPTQLHIPPLDIEAM